MSNHEQRIRRRPIAFAKAWILWVSNPVSERGAANVFQMIYASGGPNLRRMCDAMRRHPVGARLLSERPDLGRTLADLPRLMSMPPGSIGRTYAEFVAGPETLPGYLLAGLAYRHGAFDRLDWPDDMKWLIERVANTHDLAHLLSGYGSDLAGEALNTNFTLGIVDLPLIRYFSLVFAAGSALVLNPRCGLWRWWQLMREAYERGRTTARVSPFWSIAFEDLLPLSKSEARSAIGIPPLTDGSSELDTRDWLDNRISRQIATGFGAMNRAMIHANQAKQLVAGGLTPREIMSTSAKTRRHLDKMRTEGASVEQLVAEIRSRAAS